MKLSKRLEAITKYVPKNSIVADIGTDHGYIPVYLIKNKISKRVIGSDISSGSLEKIQDYVLETQTEEFIDIRLGDGMEVLKPYEVDTVVIAGMGGILMTEILDKDLKLRDSVVRYILQPMVGVKELREYLFSNNFKLIEEDLVFEDEKYYEIMVVEKGIEPSKEEIYFDISDGLIKKEHPLLKDYINFKINKNNIILNNLKSSRSKESLEKKKALEELISNYERVLLDVKG